MAAPCTYSSTHLRVSSTACAPPSPRHCVAAIALAPTCPRVDSPHDAHGAPRKPSHAGARSDPRPPAPYVESPSVSLRESVDSPCPSAGIIPAAAMLLVPVRAEQPLARPTRQLRRAWRRGGRQRWQRRWQQQWRLQPPLSQPQRLRDMRRRSASGQAEYVRVSACAS